eukprot:TRINITY_DN16362_c0_g1_i1.p1 TRINITY_DN16362_c0_g1~~TRINITY_DN16362_c0_g1_i1.p1  ORF type:complete len:254 (+),score=52.61 TRINITY_DN16362_c0_g1_i1:64-825(+)
MGCGASNDQKPAKTQEEKPRGLTQAQQNEIAVQGLRDALTWAIEQTMVMGKNIETWSTPEYKIQVPCMDKVEKLKAKVADVPLVGGTLSSSLEKACEPFEDQFANAAMTICQDSRTQNTFVSIIQGLSAENAVELCKSGGVSACVDYLKEYAKALLHEQMTAIINNIMDSHPLTNIWKNAVEKYNMAAGKVDIEPIDFNLNEYVLNQCMDKIYAMMMTKEKEIRAAPANAVSWAVQQVFSGVDPANWKQKSAA